MKNMMVRGFCIQSEERVSRKRELLSVLKFFDSMSKARSERVQLVFTLSNIFVFLEITTSVEW